MDANVLAYHGDRLQTLNQRTTFIGSVPVSHCDGSLLHQVTAPSSAAHYSICRQVTRLPMNTKRSPLVTGTFNEYGD